MELVRTVFNFFDHDNEGSIEGAEIKAQLKAENIDDSVWDELIMDALGKTECTFDDFVKLINDL
jgi:Ca2+-binding EF-hand superfamily protein